MTDNLLSHQPGQKRQSIPYSNFPESEARNGGRLAKRGDRVRRIITFWVGLVISAGSGSAAALPDYTVVQLQDAEFVHQEIDRLSKLRDEVVTQSESASTLVQITLKKELRNLDVTLEALRYVESTGYKADDPELAKLEYFQLSKERFDSGFQHNMKSAGPRGGRVSFLDGKPASRSAQSKAPRRSPPPKHTSSPTRTRR